MIKNNYNISSGKAEHPKKKIISSKVGI